MPAHLRPSAPTAPQAIVCGDPARALSIAQSLLVQPRMSNHHRGLWGYYGETRRGRELTVQATGIGAPSAVVVLAELAELGVERLIRIGTCSAAAGSAPLGRALVAVRAIAADGASEALGYERGSTLEPDPDLTAALRERSGASPVVVHSRDLLADPPEGPAGSPEPPVADLQSAAVLAFARRSGLGAAVGLVVARAGARRLEDEPLEAELLRLAAAAGPALASL